jgi:hypothetical protein
MARGIPQRKWAGSSFTGQNRVRYPDGEHVCEACVYLCARHSPVPGRPPKPGKKFGANFRNVSHLYDSADTPPYFNASKGEKPAILAFLRRHHRHWFAAIADSGQKHVLPWCPVNPPNARRGIVLFEEATVRLPVPNGAGWTIVDRMADLLTAGCTKDEIATARYTPRAWQLCGEAALRSFEEMHGERARGSAWFDLALWLAQRDEEAVAARIAAEKEAKKRGKTRRGAARKAARRDRRPAAGAAGGVSGGGGESTQALGPATEQDDQRGAQVGDAGRVGDADDAGAAAAGAQQGRLPGIA